MKQLLLFFLLSIPTVAQKSFLVKDSLTNEPIAYTSIFTENGTFKINAEPDGSFIIPNEFLHEIFVFDAVGYEPKQQSLIKYYFVKKNNWENITQYFLVEHIEKKAYSFMCELTLTN